MLVGYMRVSKADGSQSTDLQRDALLVAGVDPDNLYEDQASGEKDDRPHLAACLKALRHGDTLLVWKLDRLGRDLRHLVNTVHDLTDRGIGLKVLTGEGAAIDTSHSMRKTAGTIIARNLGVSAATTALGHSSDAVTRGIYIDSIQTPTDLSEALSLLTPAIEGGPE
ncbi:recombinase family protein [Cryobacterium suzukii]|uniref:recombinase family protein n=1 Tax=Cryobacterium suzukii TaxID=1259198 RepID=UPI001F54265D|nr:recombinase family protein [Cryobacterium suzukii]